ncbi:MAG: PaaI family thioesterase [Candidatus Dadabacteria bacterium]|nr:MAG: PaaI family thioesterase [Candidatus Dadabacteria bacterium]
MTEFAEMMRRYRRPDKVDDPLWNKRRELAALLRDLVVAPVRDDLDEAVIDELLAALQPASARLRQEPPFAGYGDGRFYDHPEWFEDRNPVLGLSSAMAPPLYLEESAERVHGHVTLSAAYEGPPGTVHGGFVATILDQACGRIPVNAAIPCMTGGLHVRYRKPTPINRKLSVSAEMVSCDARKAVVQGRIVCGDTVTAEAEAVFVNLSGHDFLAHVNQYDDSDQPAQET